MKIGSPSFSKSSDATVDQFAAAEQCTHVAVLWYISTRGGRGEEENKKRRKGRAEEEGEKRKEEEKRAKRSEAESRDVPQSYT